MIDKIKKAYNSDQVAARSRYKELFYYLDGMVGTKESQSVHPAGMVISPIDLGEEYGVFHKDGDLCLVLDMDELHEVGAAKYDFLVLKTIQVIRDTCRLIGVPYPRSHEIDWEDQAVWNDMLRSPGAIFQMEGKYAFDNLKKFKPSNIFDISLVTAAIRPSGASYRDDMLDRKPRKNPSDMIDKLLENNIGYLVYQEDIIAFLQQVCGLTGSEADTVRRGIARKKPEVLAKSLPKIVDGYCSKSDKPREIAEKECSEFLQIIEDASNYMFGYNHSIAYCLLSYLCAYYRYYHPVEFITAFLNCAANDDDIVNGTVLAKLYGVSVTPPRFGISKSDYFCDKENRIIAKGLSSIKYIGSKLADEVYAVSHLKDYKLFSEVLMSLHRNSSIDARQLNILIGIDFFSKFGNQRELETIVFVFDLFKQGDAKQISKARIAGSYFEDAVRNNAIGVTKAGKESANWILTDVNQIIFDCEKRVQTLNLSDYGVICKVRRFTEAMGYSGYISGREEDRRLLEIKDVFPLKRKKDGKQFGYSLITRSIGSGKESRFTIFNRLYDTCPIGKGDIIYCSSYDRDGMYFTMTGYKKYDEIDEMMEGV